MIMKITGKNFDNIMKITRKNYGKMKINDNDVGKAAT